MGGEASNGESSQPLGTKGGELCPGHRRIMGVVKDKHDLAGAGSGWERVL